jgi:hypothetical protein
VVPVILITSTFIEPYELSDEQVPGKAEVLVKWFVEVKWLGAGRFARKMRAAPG